jgi:hypothetical protein
VAHWDNVFIELWTRDGMITGVVDGHILLTPQKKAIKSQLSRHREYANRQILVI